MTDTSKDAVDRLVLAMIRSGNTTAANMLTALADERDAANARADQARDAAVAWQVMATAPRDGTWFWAETQSGQGRWVHFADRFDRYPIDHDGECWSTEPIRWRPDYPPTPPDSAELELPEVRAMVDALREIIIKDTRPQGGGMCEPFIGACGRHAAAALAAIKEPTL